MKHRIPLSLLFSALVVLGCESSPDTTKPPTSKEVETFKGKPLTPEQVERLRGGMGGNGPAGPSTLDSGKNKSGG